MADEQPLPRAIQVILQQVDFGTFQLEFYAKSGSPALRRQELQCVTMRAAQKQVTEALADDDYGPIGRWAYSLDDRGTRYGRIFVRWEERS